MRTMTFAFPAIERLVYGNPAADTLRAERGAVLAALKIDSPEQILQILAA